MNETTSLLCLFHHEDHASAALHDLHQAGVPQSAITSIAGPGAQAQLAAFGMPDRDRTLVEKNLRDGGSLLAVKAGPEHVSLVERVFAAHSAHFVDEFDRQSEPETAAALPTAIDSGRSIPVLDEQMVVGKRTVDQGGVRVFRRVVEIPVSESVTLHKEHVVMDRHAVDRPATEADLASEGKSLVLTEKDEEVVLSKSARVIEEVLVTTQSSDRVEHVQETVRRTEIDVEELPAELNSHPAPRTH